MEKLVYVVWKKPELSDRQFEDEMLGPVTERMLGLDARKLAINLVDEHVEHALAVRITKLDPPISGVVSFWLDAADDRAPHEEALREVTVRQAGYLVVESVPIVNRTHTAPLGERTPGINMIALIEKPDRMTYEDWIAHWHGHHKRVAIETQCTYAYVRNVVVRALTEGAPPWAGIVEEGFPTEAVTDPMIWYCAGGDTKKLEENMAKMIESVQAFLDIDRVESHPMSEYVMADGAAHLVDASR
jgi:hypothetical protein